MHRAITYQRVREAIALDTQEGFCRKCGESQDCVEPDARNYKCESCGADEVFGAEELLYLIG